MFYCTDKWILCLFFLLMTFFLQLLRISTQQIQSVTKREHNYHLHYLEKLELTCHFVCGHV